MRPFRRNLDIVQNNRLDAQQFAGMESIVEHRDGDTALVQPSSIEAYTHDPTRFLSFMQFKRPISGQFLRNGSFLSHRAEAVS